MLFFRVLGTVVFHSSVQKTSHRQRTMPFWTRKARTQTCTFWDLNYIHTMRYVFHPAHSGNHAHTFARL